MEVTAVTSSDMVSTLTLTSLAASVSGLYTCVAINSAGVSASSVRLSMGPRLLSLDLWLPILLGFLSVFCIFAGVICSVMCCRSDHFSRYCFKIIFNTSLNFQETATKRKTNRKK